MLCPPGSDVTSAFTFERLCVLSHLRTGVKTVRCISVQYTCIMGNLGKQRQTWVQKWKPTEILSANYFEMLRVYVYLYEYISLHVYNLCTFYNAYSFPPV